MTQTTARKGSAIDRRVRSLTKFLDPLPIPRTLRPVRGRDCLTTVAMMQASHRFHHQLSPSRVWTYEGTVPGPTIEVRRGQRIRVAWQNRINGDFPVSHVVVPTVDGGPGRQNIAPDPLVAAIPPWAVVHLHGALTDGGNDGWTQNAVLPGRAQLAEYLNDQRATALWYHDHAMGVTAYNVMAGLAGMYLIRDEEEDALSLPHGSREIPLVICDRNLDTDDDGFLTGTLLHKVGVFEAGTPPITFPFVGPYTVVNGKIWPHIQVRNRWYRFRILNASNARAYQLALHGEDGASIPGVFRQIGTDGGLLPAPVTLDQLSIAPAERLDVLIDFGALAGRTLTMVNTAPNAAVDPEVMQFRVSNAAPSPHPFVLPTTLSTTADRLNHESMPSHGHRWLVVTLVAHRHPEVWEMEEADPATLPPLPADGIVQVQLPGHDGIPGHLVTLRRVARRFDDAPSIYIDDGAWEQWSFLNLSPVEHPMHIHLIHFQVMDRHAYDRSVFDAAIGGTRTPAVPTGEVPVPAAEQGWKDVTRVPGGQLVRLAGRFGGGQGRFMYHCHILEHEDAGMMGAFIVAPAAVSAVSPHMGGGHGHS